MKKMKNAIALIGAGYAVGIIVASKFSKNLSDATEKTELPSKCSAFVKDVVTMHTDMVKSVQDYFSEEKRKQKMNKVLHFRKAIIKTASELGKNIKKEVQVNMNKFPFEQPEKSTSKKESENEPGMNLSDRIKKKNPEIQIVPLNVKQEDPEI